MHFPAGSCGQYNSLAITAPVKSYPVRPCAGRFSDHRSQASGLFTHYLLLQRVQLCLGAAVTGAMASTTRVQGAVTSSLQFGIIHRQRHATRLALSSNLANLPWRRCWGIEVPLAQSAHPETTHLN